MISERLIQIDKFTDIESNIIASTFASFPAINTLVFRASNPTLDQLRALEVKLNSSYEIQIGFFSPEPNKKPPSNLNPTNLTSRPPHNQLELEAQLEKSFENNFALSWSNQISDRFIESARKTLISNSRPADSLFVFEGEILVGLISCFPSVCCLKNPLCQIGWIWISDQLSPYSRKQCHQMFSQWLFHYKAYPLYQAGVHILNKRSQNFFNKMGFIPKCIHITKKQLV